MTEATIYGRPKTLLNQRTHYCAGCGHGILQRLIAELIDEMSLRDKTVMVAPVGCSVILYDYIDVDCTEAAHGRAPAVATGIKRARPDLFVVSYQGDGDIAAIGLAEIVHAANRGENFVAVFVNNTIYAMTGGQMAPTTMDGQKTQTCPGGRDPQTMGHPIRMCELIETLDGPAYIVRTMLNGPAGVKNTKKALRRAFECQLEGKGFSLVEVLSPCPTFMGPSPLDSMKHVESEVSRYYPVRVFRECQSG